MRLEQILSGLPAEPDVEIGHVVRHRREIDARLRQRLRDPPPLDQVAVLPVTGDESEVPVAERQQAFRELLCGLLDVVQDRRPFEFGIGGRLQTGYPTWPNPRSLRERRGDDDGPGDGVNQVR